MELLKLSKKKMFGSSAEKIAQAYGQISFFNEAEQERTPLTPELKIEEIVIPKHTRKKKRSYDERNCDKTDIEANFVTAVAPKPLIEKSLVSASMYSLIETAKANDLKVYDYLTWMFENIHILPYDELLPWSKKIPKKFHKR